MIIQRRTEAHPPIDPHCNSVPLFIHTYRRTAAGAILNVIVLKVAQILALMAVTLMILVWRQIVQAAQKMKRTKGNDSLNNIVCTFDLWYGRRRGAQESDTQTNSLLSPSSPAKRRHLHCPFGPRDSAQHCGLVSSGY